MRRLTPNQHSINILKDLQNVALLQVNTINTSQIRVLKVDMTTVIYFTITNMIHLSSNTMNISTISPLITQRKYNVITLVKELMTEIEAIEENQTNHQNATTDQKQNFTNV